MENRQKSSDRGYRYGTSEGYKRERSISQQSKRSDKDSKDLLASARRAKERQNAYRTNSGGSSREVVDHRGMIHRPKERKEKVHDNRIGRDKYGASGGLNSNNGSSSVLKKELVMRGKSTSGGSSGYPNLRDRTSSNESGRSRGSASPKKYARVGTKQYNELKRLASGNSQKSDGSFHSFDDY